MILSNRGKRLISLCLFSISMAGCGSGGQLVNAPGNTETEAESSFPFSTREPEEYQATAVTSDGTIEIRWFIARKGELRRIDHYSDGQPSFSEIINGRAYYVDHGTRRFAIAAETSGAMPPDALGEWLFAGRQFRNYADTGPRDGRIIYKAGPSEDSKSEVIIEIDEASGMIVRQETSTPQSVGIPARIVYELRDLRLGNVDDSLFEVPTGYAEAPLATFRQRAAGKK